LTPVVRDPGCGPRRCRAELHDPGRRHSHPYYWAAFSIVGDVARALPSVSLPPSEGCRRTGRRLGAHGFGGSM